MNEAENRSNQAAHTQPEGNGEQKNQNERKFSQEDVNRIVKERLERERAKAAEPSPEIQQRLDELDAREKKIICKEHLIESNLPSDLLDVFDTSDPEEFKCKVAKAMDIFLAYQSRNRGHASPQYCAERPVGNGPFASAFERGVKHEPGGYYGELVKGKG